MKDVGSEKNAIFNPGKGGAMYYFILRLFFITVYLPQARTFPQVSPQVGVASVQGSW
jgi:hypothetical protein